MIASAGARPTRWLAAVGLALAAATALAQGGAAAPGAGFVDPKGLPARPAPVDVEPVYRAPSIDTLATVRKRGLLRVGVVAVDPMVMRDERGELVGYSVDLARRLAQDIGVEVEFVPSSWVDLLPDLLGRHFDIVATGLWITVPRALVVNFTDATATQGVYLMASRAKAAGKSTLADFNQAGVTIAVFPGTPQEALVRRLLPRAAVLTVAGDDSPLAPVLQGRADAALVPTLVPQLYARAAPDQLVLPLAQPLASASSAIALRKGDVDFLAFLNTWLALQRESGWLDERLQHWTTLGTAAR